MATSETEIFVALLGIIGVAVGAIVTYILTKKKEIELDKRQRTLERYDDLLTKLTNLVRDISNGEMIHEFILAYYRAGSYATEGILKNCYQLLEKLAQSSDGTGRITLKISEVESIIQGIYNDVRKELNPKVKTFEFRAYHVKEDGEMINVHP
jgi:predicted ATP-binding protein involved in virulence